MNTTMECMLHNGEILCSPPHLMKGGAERVREAEKDLERRHRKILGRHMWEVPFASWLWTCSRELGDRKELHGKDMCRYLEETWVRPLGKLTMAAVILICTLIFLLLSPQTCLIPTFLFLWFPARRCLRLETSFGPTLLGWAFTHEEIVIFWCF